MRRAWLLTGVIVLLWVGTVGMVSEGLARPRPIRAAMVTGGHDYEREPFGALLAALGGVVWTEASHPDAHALFGPRQAERLDVLVFYDMPQTISEPDKAQWLQLLGRGKGMVFLHHSLGAYQNWPEYRKIIGGRFRIAEETDLGRQRPASTYEHGVRMKVQVAARRHPVCRGVSDFEIIDETYGDFDVESSVTPLLRTDHPASGPVIGWAHRYRRSRVAYLMLGHDHTAYENADFRRLLDGAIRWAAGR